MSTDAYMSSSRISSVGRIKTFPIEVTEQRILKFNRNKGFSLKLNGNPMNLIADCFKFRGIFIQTDLIENIEMNMIIGGQPIFNVPLKLLYLLNDRLDIPNYISFNHDLFFSDFIYTNLLKYHLIEVVFSNVPDEIKEIEVLFDTMLLESHCHTKKETRFKTVSEECGTIMQNILVYKNKANIKSIELNVTPPGSSTKHNVFKYDEKLVSIYGVKINDNVTCFSMNPLLPWDSHESNSGLHAYWCEVEDNVEGNPKIYYLSQNALRYSNGMCGTALST